MDIEILPTTGKLNYLGHMITFRELMVTELQHRIKAAWATFTHHRQELTNKNYPLSHRLRLFNATVTPTVLYASGTWTLTEAMGRQLNTTQRRMLRLIINAPRRRNHTDDSHNTNDTNDFLLLPRNGCVRPAGHA